VAPAGPPVAPAALVSPPVTLVVGEAPLLLQPIAIGALTSSARTRRCVFGVVFMASHPFQASFKTMKANNEYPF
jgi:hypothetical protein